jgi:large subunit ribosomal protein L6
MSRVAKNPISIPKGVEVRLEGQHISVKGLKGLLSASIHPLVGVDVSESEIRVRPTSGTAQGDAQAGTARAVLNNMVLGVSQGYEKKLSIVGVGYRAAVKGDILSLSLGFSHPVDFVAPAGITLETPTQTEIVVRGCDRQLVGQVASDIRSYRPPEPYKGKGVRYSDEVIIKKETKKK